MKKSLIFLFVFIASNILLSAQTDNKALVILDAMSARYSSIQAFKAEFSYSIESPSSGVNENFKGEITVKGEKYRLKTDGQEIFNNGKIISTYLPDENEVNISYYQPEEDEITPSKIYTIYKTGYKYIFIEEKKEGGNVYDIIELIPDKKDKQIFKIRLQISKKDKTLKNWKLFEKNGTKYQYTITKFNSEVKVDDNFFEFDKAKYKGVEVVDLR